tara:strand:+ start:281 stop:439 length:159 start_codon:yes stop_codon:yes gene_type:complete
MLRLGLAGTPPFEGSPNYVPISNIPKGITLDLLEIIDDDAPEPFKNIHNIQM